MRDEPISNRLFFDFLSTLVFEVVDFHGFPTSNLLSRKKAKSTFWKPRQTSLLFSSVSSLSLLSDPVWIVGPAESAAPRDYLLFTPGFYQSDKRSETGNRSYLLAYQLLTLLS